VKPEKKKESNRREFLQTSSAAMAGVGYWVAARPAFAASKSPNEKLNVAVIGAGGKGHSDCRNVAKTENIVALCDVDDKRASGIYTMFPKVKKYKDYREMLEKEEKNIDAVTVSTPDHTHAPASIMAMKMGKHCYCQKPLTHAVYEARMMKKVASEAGVATQMGNQGTGHDGLREAVEVIQSGGIGKVREAHVWTNRPVWPQATEAILKHRGVHAALHGANGSAGTPSAPPSMAWDLWLGTAPFRPYDPIYAPFAWRGWWDFGTGALGDMACHTANMAFMALKLGSPTSFQAISAETNSETYQAWSTITYEFPARGDLPPVKYVWYDGTKRGKRNLPSKDVVGDLKISSSGSLLIGDKGMLYSPNDYGSSYKLLPKEKFADYEKPAPTLPRIHSNLDEGNHHREWIAACKGGPKAMSNFDYAAALTETVLLGNLAVRAGGLKVEWDGPNMKAKNWDEGAKLVKPEYRKGWTL